MKSVDRGYIDVWGTSVRQIKPRNKQSVLAGYAMDGFHATLCEIVYISEC